MLIPFSPMNSRNFFLPLNIMLMPLDFSVDVDKICMDLEFNCFYQKLMVPLTLLEVG